MATALEIIGDALRELGVIREDEDVSPGDYSFSFRALNRLIKHWQNFDVHLWLKKTGVIFLQKNQREYLISSTGDHSALAYSQAALDADYALGVSQVSFDGLEAFNGHTIAVNDHIGIVLDAGSIYWDTVSNVVDADTVDLTGTLPSAAAENNPVYIYKDKISNPLTVYSAVRESTSEIDIPMFRMSYEEYFQLPNKTSESTPVNFMYDRQKDVARILVWPEPPDVEYLMKITYSERITSFVTAADNADFPDTWEQALVSNMAAKLAPAYGKAKTAKYQALKLEAETSLEEALQFDNEEASVFLQPDFYS